MLQNKRILLGVCGSIAAYKSASLIRLLVKAGAEVKVVMTASASSFITPLTLSTLSKSPVLAHFEKGGEGLWNNHVELGLWADLMLVAPASAHTIAKFAQGLCDNLLCATYLSARCPVFLAPAMDLDMYQHPTTLKNLITLQEYGNHIIDASTGELASGLFGPGRMAEPEDIFAVVEDYFAAERALQDRKVLITAGPTYEAIDPVRFIGNHSSGKMGFALAEAAAKLGAQVTLVSGPSQLEAQHPAIHTHRVTSAQEMYEVVRQNYHDQDILIFAAAVADYTPTQVADQKIKSSSEAMTITLEKTKDIAAEIGKIKKRGQFMAGFALETENEASNAHGKLVKKNFDLIVLNSLNDKGAGFSHDTNKITILDRNNKQETFELKHKSKVARDILQAIISRYGK